MKAKYGYAAVQRGWSGIVSVLGRATTDDGIRGMETIRTNGLVLFPTLAEALEVGRKYSDALAEPLEYVQLGIRFPTSRSDVLSLQDRNGLVAVTSESSGLWDNSLIDFYGPDLTEPADCTAPDYVMVTHNELTPFRGTRTVIPNSYSSKRTERPRRNGFIRITPYQSAITTREKLRDTQPQKKASIAQFRAKRVA